jgi:hypothetical protein
MPRFIVRSQVMVSALLFCLTLALGAARAAEPTVELLFVQNSQGVVVDKDKGTLTLKGVGPTTLFFSDRPYRLAGHYTTEEYLELWDDGKDSFLADPPNATLSVFEPGKEDLVDLVVELRNPRPEGADFSYDIKILSGKISEVGGPSSLFIDIIGMPWTPLSYAGVARRWTRRAVFADAAFTSEAAAATLAAPPPPAQMQPAAGSSHATPEQELRELKSLLDQGLISESDYQAKKQEILNRLAQ